ncbi:MAG: orotidine-5'-phosphate decarboxylase [Nanoarchaeota archaeon]
MAKTFVEKLRVSADDSGSIICFGMDPTEAVFSALERPHDASGYPSVFVKFFDEILVKMADMNVWPGAFKPNDAYWAKFDGHLHGENHGRRALGEVINIIRRKRQGAPVIIDAKRADIGATSECYAEEFAGWRQGDASFGWCVDAITINPYLGSDGVEPFFKRLGAYVLDRTSNPSACELQNLVPSHRLVVGKDGARSLQELKVKEPLYLHEARQIVEWAKKFPGNVGAVVGATALDELEDISRVYVESGLDIPLLIPGVGKQGGSAKDVVDRLRKAGYDLSIVRINLSSGLSYAFEKEPGDSGKKDFAGASVRALKRLNDEVGYRP